MPTILVIDDHNEIRENIEEILSLAGYNVTTADNGKKGIDLAVHQKPDLIICDIAMPELDGYSVLHLLRKKEDTTTTPFIFLTAKTERSDFRKGMELGADDYITKPFDDLELLNAIEARLKKANILHNKYEDGEQGASRLMQELSDSGLMKMQWDNYETIELSKRTTLYQEGKKPRYLYFLKSGKIKTYRVHEEGKSYVTNLYVAGSFIGYLALLENRTYDDTAEILEQAEAVLIPAGEFLAAVYNDIHIAAKFIKIIASNVKTKEDRLLNLAYSSLRKRVAAALLDIHGKFIGKDDAKTVLNISRDNIAHYAGVATESLIRTLGDFKTEKLIELNNGKIIIVDKEKLASLLY